VTLNRALRILLLEHDPEEAGNIEMELRRAGFAFEMERVETKNNFLEKIKAGPDVILADLGLPSFDGVSALLLAKQHCPEVPFILLSDSFAHDLLLDVLQRGATDVIQKSRLAYLPAALRRVTALIEAREERRRADDVPMRLALTMCQKVLSTPGYEARLMAVCEEIKAAFGFSRVVLFLVTETGNRIRGMAGVGLPESYIRAQEYALEMKPGVEIAHAICRASLLGEMEVCRDRAEDPVYYAWLLGQAAKDKTYAKEYACIPLKAYGAAIGVLVVSVLEHEGRLTDDKLSTFCVFADLVSLILLQAKTEFETREALMSVLAALASMVEARDAYTSMHAENVMAYSTALARALRLKEDEIDHIRLGALLHDIGKISIPDAILRKPGALTDAEFREMRLHPPVGDDLLSGVRLLESARVVVRHHHERWDGKGYPDGLKGDQIPLAARVVSIADAFDAMTTDRPYRKARSFEEAVGELRKGVGTQFDPQLVKVFIDCIRFEEKELAFSAAEDQFGGCPRLKLEGDLSLPAGRFLLEKTTQELERRTALVVIDLKDIGLATDSGLWALFRIGSKWNGRGRRIIIHSNGDVRKRLVEFSDWLPMHVVETEEEVRRLISRPPA